MLILGSPVMFDEEDAWTWRVEVGVKVRVKDSLPVAT